MNIKDETAPVAPENVAYDPELIPPLELMRTEGVDTLEEWFRWAEEWSLILRLIGHVEAESNVLEIGCGLGRIAFPLRFILSDDGSYDGFDITKKKIDFLTQNFSPRFPNFTFKYADVNNTFYNPAGAEKAAEFCFPYPDNCFDTVFAASVLTHMLPEVAENYIREAARVSKVGGRCVLSFFQLDLYEPGRNRPYGFAAPIFDFDHTFENYGDQFALGNPLNPEEMTAYKLDLLERFATKSGLQLVQEPLAGQWSGSTKCWICAQDLLILRKT